MAIYSGSSNDGKYFVHYVDEGNTAEKYPPFTLALTRNSVSAEVLSQLEEMMKNLPVTDFELDFLVDKIVFPLVEKIEIID